VSRKRGKIIYWDTCIFLTWLTSDSSDPVLLAGIREVIESFHRGNIVLVTSVTTLSELLDLHNDPFIGQTIDKIFQRDNAVMMNVDQKVSLLAGQIRNYYNSLPKTHRLKIETPDATHLASAIVAGSHEFHTNDSGLLRLSPVVMSHPLIIVPPKGTQLSLL